MKTRWLVLLFVVVAAVQVAVPVTMILQRKTILRYGRTYKFRTRPVDPADAFRGRYVQLGFEQNHAPCHAPVEFQPNMELFARVADGADGFAVISEVAPTRPAQGDYVKVRLTGWPKDHADVYFTLPFDRYYLEETKARQAEKTYWEHNRRNQTNTDTYAVVWINGGDVTLADLVVGGKPIRDYFTNRKP